MSLTVKRIGEIADETQKGISAYQDTLAFARAIEAEVKPNSAASAAVGPCNCDPHVETCDQCAPYLVGKPQITGGETHTPCPRCVETKEYWIARKKWWKTKCAELESDNAILRAEILIKDAKFARLCADMDHINGESAHMLKTKDAEIVRLREELAQAKIYMPARRATAMLNTEHGKCNFEFWRIAETDEEFAAWGKEYAEVKG